MKPRTSRKDFISKAKTQFYDLIVIGGGVTGSGIVRDATIRGLKSLLIEKGDFASGTSSKSGKLVHGGLRYLKYFKLGLVFDSCLERTRLKKIVAPHIVKTTKFLIPFYKSNKDPRWLAALGLFAYDILSKFKNGSPLHFISKKKLARLEPALKKESSRGALSFNDCTCLDTRLTIDTLKSANDYGADLINYCECKNIKFDNNMISIEAYDNLENNTIVFKTQTLVNATGAWADDLLKKTNIKEPFGVKISTGIHLIIPKQKLSINHTMTIEAISDKRYLYIVPWGNKVLVGTTDNFYNGDKDTPPIKKRDIDYLLESIDFYFPTLKIKNKDIESAFSGIRPLIGSDKGKSEYEMSRDYSIKIDPRGVLSISGGKLTTYRSMAEKAVNSLVNNFFKNRSLKNCSTIAPISGGSKIREPLATISRKLNLSIEALTLLINRYGSNVYNVAYYLNKNEKNKSLVSEKIPYYWGEIQYFIEEEFAQTLSDIMIRRSTLFFLLPRGGRSEAPLIADFMGSLFTWTNEEKERQLNEFNQEIDFIFREIR